jgi:hypothetical protein
MSQEKHCNPIEINNKIHILRELHDNVKISENIYSNLGDDYKSQNSQKYPAKKNQTLERSDNRKNNSKLIN